MDVHELIAEFLKGDVYAVAGASKNREKYGNKVLRCYLQNGKRAYAINPLDDEVEGAKCVRDVFALPEPVYGLSIITPSVVTEKIVEDAGAAGIKRIWMQPGAESDRAIERCRELGIDLLAGGPCILVAMHYRER
jgi:predicted CoA-binding protein